MKKLMFTLLLCSTLSVMADGDGLFWSARDNGGTVEFFRSDVPTPGAAEFRSQPVQYLKLSNGTVQLKSVEERALVDQKAADAQAANDKAIADAKAALDKSIADAQAANDAKEAQLDAYIATATEAESRIDTSESGALATNKNDPPKALEEVRKILAEMRTELEALRTLATELKAR